MPDYLDVVVVDFDDTLCPFSEDFTCRTVVPGAIDALNRIREAGYVVVISSARNNTMYGGYGGEPHRDMVQFLHAKGIPHDRIDTGTNGKPVAYRYIDDKGVGCPLTEDGVVDWPGVCELLLGG
jgi:hypothetical protein